MGEALIMAWVREVLDGDTFRIREGTYIRLAGVEAPEKSTPYSKMATDKLSSLILHKYVRYKQVGISFGRIVAHVWVSSTNVNETMRNYISRIKK